MPTCPAGHDSSTSDYCDTCGVRIAPAPTPAPTPAAADPSPPAPPPARTCPGCGDPVDARFCESCGYDIEEDRPAAPATVTLVLGADRGHWDRLVGSGEPAFPAVAPTLTIELSGDRMTLGRVKTGAVADVDIPLSGAATDPAVSHHQCEFERDGSGWLVRDTDSVNGTWINDADESLAPGEAHHLADGDRILIGAWTCLTVRLAPTTAQGS